jgi:hypothetical protein
MIPEPTHSPDPMAEHTKKLPIYMYNQKVLRGRGTGGESILEM